MIVRYSLSVQSVCCSNKGFSVTGGGPKQIPPHVRPFFVLGFLHRSDILMWVKVLLSTPFSEIRKSLSLPHLVTLNTSRYAYRVFMFAQRHSGNQVMNMWRSSPRFSQWKIFCVQIVRPVLEEFNNHSDMKNVACGWLFVLYCLALNILHLLGHCYSSVHYMLCNELHL